MFTIVFDFISTYIYRKFKKIFIFYKNINTCRISQLSLGINSYKGIIELYFHIIEEWFSIHFLLFVKIKYKI